MWSEHHELSIDSVCYWILYSKQDILSIFPLFLLECHRVLIWCIYDWSGLLSICWSASHHSGQHRPCAGFWENPLQVLQVCLVLEQLVCDIFIITMLRLALVNSHVFLHPCFLQLSFVSGTTICPICHWGLALACGRPCCVWCWLPQMLALWCATSLGSQRRPLPPSSASSSSMRHWRS